MRTALAFALLAVAACTANADQPAAYTANPLGPGNRLAQIQNPSSSAYHVNGSAHVTSVVATWLDTFDETKDGKSANTLYVQDIASAAPYSGIGIFSPNYIPASLSILPGDVLDLTGPYQESLSLGTAIFPPGTFLPQLYKPVATYRYDFEPPSLQGGPGGATAELMASQLDGTSTNYKTNRQWLGMLVTVKDAYAAAGQSASGGNGARVTYFIGQCAPPSPCITPNSVAISNELYDLQSTDFPAGTHFASVTGIVTWFFSFHIAPRTKADLVVAQ